MKRYTAPFQKLQMLIVYSALSTLFAVTSAAVCIQALGTGDGWVLAALLLGLTGFSVYAVNGTYKDLSFKPEIERNTTDTVAPDNQVQSRDCR